MARSQQSFNKAEREKKRLKKRKDKLAKQEERKANSKSGGDLDSMIAYVDEFGNITDTPPDPTKRKKVDAESIAISVPKQENVEVSPFRTGKVEFYNDAKGFGFIKDAETQEKYFFHINSVIDEVVENDKVAFELEQGMKGINAVRVKKV